ncbi:MAG: OmpA family protein [Flavobacteriales bacterium]|nr:OmpA family protein [Flavobacteriales bacterium]
MKKILLTILVTLTMTVTVFSQEFLGLRQSNYSGIMGSDLNPASIADNRLKFDLLLFGGYVGGFNNHMQFNTSKMPNWWIKSFNSKYPDSDAWMNNGDLEKLVSADSTASFKARGLGQLFEIDNGNVERAAFLSAEFDVLNFMITIDRKRAIGFQIRSRSILNMDDVSPELIRLATNDFEFPNVFDINIADEDFNLTMNSWIEYNLSYAQVLSDKNENFFKIGGKLKFLQGVASGYLHSSDLNFSIKNDTTSNSISGNFDYGYSENFGGFIEPNENLGDAEKFSGSSVTDFASNLGLGIDVGIIYEWRPNWKKYKYDMDGETDLWMRDQNKYKLKVGLAINDIGGMRYDKGGSSNNFNINVGVFDLQKFDNTQGFRSLDSTLQNFADSGWVKFDNNDDKEFYMNLPTHINFDVDYHIFKNFYANFYTRLNMKFGNDVNTVKYPTSFALTPRFDHRRWGVSLPLSYNKIAGFRTGLAFRLGGYLSIGTGDIKPLFAPGRDMNIRGVDVFVTLRAPILFKAPKDRDKDKVSDKLDQCIDIPGTWALRGCSDVDNDGILDQNDSCVTDSGLVKFNGCPDRDGDDIIDKDDDCPDTPGIPEFNGCPDTDGDGIMDKEDDCPTIPGPIENNGCPYKLLHTIDSLGMILETDTMFSDEKYYRFENLRSDQSQLFMLGEDDNSEFIRIILGNDTVTALRNDKGYYYYEYLPPVPVEIELMEEEEEILKAAFDNLEFETGKAIIKQSSYASLEDLAKLLMKKLEWRIKVSGHTDSQGRASSNMRLSKKRSKAVANFLILNDVYKERIDVEWFGETKPIADNKKKEGRQKNRRVEMEIL